MDDRGQGCGLVQGSGVYGEGSARQAAGSGRAATGGCMPTWASGRREQPVAKSDEGPRWPPPKSHHRRKAGVGGRDGWARRDLAVVDPSGGKGVASPPIGEARPPRQRRGRAAPRRPLQTTTGSFLIVAISEQASESGGDSNSPEESSNPLGWKSFDMRAVVAATEDLLLFILPEKGLRAQAMLARVALGFRSIGQAVNMAPEVWSAMFL
ncbi:hypothetical protein NL676_033046 [Syzygium grande]|nr:hypothetical protein NL676_033046 [Syzygium grande]